MISLIIITKNEEQDLYACLASVSGLVDEIILVDSGSTDKTLEIAKRYGVKIFHREWNGFGPQKQFALEKASGHWIINLDADERLTPELKNEIRKTLQGGHAPVNGYEIPYRHFFLGRRLRFGGVGNESHIRLFRKDKASYGDRLVHEGISVEPPIGRLSFSIDHKSYDSIAEYLTKCNLYTTLIAKDKYAKGERFHFWHHLRLPIEFLKRYVLFLGFLDGRPGLIYSLLSSYYVWMKFLKLKDCEAGKI